VNTRLQLLILAQAMDDLLAGELGEELSEEDLDTAETYVAAYPELLERVWEGKDLERWRRDINRARADIVFALEIRRAG